LTARRILFDRSVARDQAQIGSAEVRGCLQH
jgi:hypothetical protein